MATEKLTVLRLTRPQVVALIDIVTTYMRLDEPQRFLYVGNRESELDACDLLGHLMNAADFELVDAELQPGMIEVPSDSTLEALLAQHRAIDLLMAMLISRESEMMRLGQLQWDESFMPSKSLIWPMLLLGHAAISREEKNLLEPAR